MIRGVPPRGAADQAYHDFRADLMVQNSEGLTKTYNRFHDLHDRDLDRLCQFHAEMDRAVLAAYGWTDIPTERDFFAEHEDDDESASRRKKRRYRYGHRNP